MEIWNSRSLDNNQRFIYALIAGFVSAVVLGIAYGIIYGFLRIQSAVLYLLVGWCIGYVIRYTGHGVHNRFAVASACFTLLAIIIGDTIAMCGGLSGIPALLKNPGMWGTLLENWLRIYLSTNMSSLLGLAMRALGVYFGYRYSVIL